MYRKNEGERCKKPIPTPMLPQQRLGSSTPCAPGSSHPSHWVHGGGRSLALPAHLTLKAHTHGAGGSTTFLCNGNWQQPHCASATKWQIWPRVRFQGGQAKVQTNLPPLESEERKWEQIQNAREQGFSLSDRHRQAPTCLSASETEDRPLVLLTLTILSWLLQYLIFFLKPQILELGDYVKIFF